MYVIVVGNPAEGFNVFGPLSDSDDACAVGEWARAKYGGSDFYQCKLSEPPEDGISVNKAGTFAVWANKDNTEPFEFFGPLDYDAATDYAERFGGCAMMLGVIDREDIAA